VCRPVTSDVSVFSDFVAKGHQAMHHVSSSLSKIPYGGFSPVRLQTGCQPRPSPHRDGLSAKPASPVPRPTYTGPQPAARRGVTPRQDAGTPVIEPKLKRHSPPPPPALQSRGPWLARGFCCPAGSSLTMASCETLAPLPATYALYAGSSPDGLVWAGSERFPNLLRLSLPAVPPSVPRWTDRVPVAVPSSVALAFTFFAEARHPHVSPAVGSRGGCVTRLQSSLHATARQDCWPFTDKDGYTRAFARRVAPKRASGITMRANSQFPQPDLHRQDMRPYGLHAKDAKEVPIFKALTRGNSEMRFGRFRSGSSSDLMRVGESLRSWRSWR
jgi:hypothetical protein